MDITLVLAIGAGIVVMLGLALSIVALRRTGEIDDGLRAAGFMNRSDVEGVVNTAIQQFANMKSPPNTFRTWAIGYLRQHYDTRKTTTKKVEEALANTQLKEAVVALVSYLLSQSKLEADTQQAPIRRKIEEAKADRNAIIKPREQERINADKELTKVRKVKVPPGNGKPTKAQGQTYVESLGLEDEDYTGKGQAMNRVMSETDDVRLEYESKAAAAKAELDMAKTDLKAAEESAEVKDLDAQLSALQAKLTGLSQGSKVLDDIHIALTTEPEPEPESEPEPEPEPPPRKRRVRSRKAPRKDTPRDSVPPSGRLDDDDKGVKIDDDDEEDVEPSPEDSGEEMSSFCGGCGTPFKDGEKFCSHCGVARPKRG